MSSLLELLNKHASTEVINPYESSDITKTASAYRHSDADVESLDLDFLSGIRGQIAAHATFDEFSQIQEKVASQTCRYCKSAPMLAGASWCKSCGQGGE